MSTTAHIATRKGVFRVDRGADGWSVAHASFLGDNCSLVALDQRDGALYAALGHGHFGVKLHRSRDGGKRWEQIATPTYPEKPADAPAGAPTVGKPAPWSLELVWALEAGGRHTPDRLWCGTIPGGLFRSDDAGANWALVRSLWDRPEHLEWFGGGYDYPGIHSICVDPRDADHVTVGVSCGGAWRTTDGGDTWSCCARGMRAEYMPPERAHDENIQDPHLLVQCPAHPDAMWVQHHNGVFRSTDGAATWQELTGIEPSAFGFAVAVHPREVDTAWFVPAVKDEVRIPVDGRLVVTRTRDGGQTFDVLRDGLPQEHAYDLTFRHALDVDDTGDRLMFGTTTGSLWVSEDQGDRWSLVSAHLPPIHAVVFV